MAWITEIRIMSGIIWTKYYMRIKPPHIIFQLNHSMGRILQLGCDVDAGEFKKQRPDNINLDVMRYHPTMHYNILADIYADARELPEKLFGQFDTVIVGEMIEHMTHEDGVKVLINSRRALKNEEGRVVITCPDDRRGLTEDINGIPRLDWYTDGVSGMHRPVPIEELLAEIKEAGLKESLVEQIDYFCFKGWGVVAFPIKEEL